jgi:hypothetical protein
MLPHIGKIFLTGFSANIFRYIYLVCGTKKKPTQKKKKTVLPHIGKIFLTGFSANIFRYRDVKRSEVVCASISLGPFGSGEAQKINL